MPEFFEVNASTPFGEIEKDLLAWYQIDKETAISLFKSFKDLKECTDFAISIGLGSPADFCGKIFLLATGEFPEIKVERTKGEGAYKHFSEFIQQEVERLQRVVLSPYVLRSLGISQSDLIIGMLNAIKFAKDEQDLVIRLNTVSPELGKKLFSEWLLTERGIEYKVFLNSITQRVASLRKRLQFYLTSLRGQNGD